jgi:hypothetical protein
VPPNARPALTWGDVMDLLLEEGFDDVAGLRQMRDGCWITDVYRVRMRTTVFVDRTGSLSFEFPPASCG